MPLAAPVVDRDALDSLRERATADAPNFFIEMVAIFTREIDKRRATIADALARGDCEGLARAAHSLGGSAKLFGAMPLAELCRQLQVIPYPAIEDARTIVAAIEEQCRGVREIIIAESRRA
jgi:HPt (histidine-containing phosphotransfer) domain-containing protein